MKPSRRAFLQTAAAVPVASIAVGLGGVEIAKVAEAVPATPPVSYPWRWFVSHDGEVYHECFDTMAQAVEYAKECEYSIVAECQHEDFDLSLEGYDIIELLQHGNEERIGEGEFIEATTEQERDLGDMVTAAIEAWAAKHKISLTACSFGDVRNKTEVTSSAGMTQG